MGTKRGSQSREPAYLLRERDHRPLRFSNSGDPRIEASYTTHWVPPTLPDAKKERLAAEQSRAPDLVVVSPLKEWKLECGPTLKPFSMRGDALDCAADRP
jgi:hypothetical protein